MENMAYRHKFEVRDNHAEFFVVRKNGEQYTVLIDIEDLERVLTLRWCVMPHLRSGFYVINQPSYKKRIYLHRFVMNAPDNMMVDHKNHDPFDNRKSELRLATRSLNGFNRKGPTSKNRSGYRGVSFHRLSGKWSASVKFNGVHKSLGYYDDPKEAGDKVTEFLLTNDLITPKGVCHQL